MPERRRAWWLLPSRTRSDLSQAPSPRNDDTCCTASVSVLMDDRLNVSWKGREIHMTQISLLDAFVADINNLTFSTEIKLYMYKNANPSLAAMPHLQFVRASQAAWNDACVCRCTWSATAISRSSSV